MRDRLFLQRGALSRGGKTGWAGCAAVQVKRQFANGRMTQQRNHVDRVTERLFETGMNLSSR